MLNLIVTGGTSSGGSGAFSLNIPTGGTGVVPSPLFSPSETPSGINAAGYVQDVNGNWHSQLGIDAVTTDPTGGPPAPAGTLTFFRRTYFRDTLAATQIGKNALLSLNHAAGVGTVSTNQDRGMWITMGNTTGTITSFSISSNIVTFVVSSLNSNVSNTPTFQVGQLIVASNLSVGTYLNGQKLTIQSVTGTNTATNTITASSGTFTHANVGSTNDTGQLDQVIWSMANLQLEQDIVGTPVVQGGVDTEFSTLSVQMADTAVGNPSGASFGVNCIRANYFREIGAGWWGSTRPAVIRAVVTNLSTVNASGTTLNGIIITCTNPNGSTNLHYQGLWIPTPFQRFDGGNVGIQIDSFGSNVNDYAINVAGGQCLFGGNVTISGTLTPSTWSSQAANAFLGGPNGSSGAATFRTLVANDYPTMIGDSGLGGTKGAVPAPPAGSAAGGEFLKADGTWAVPPSGGSGVVASVDLTNQTANIGTATLYAVPGGGSGMYRAVAYVIVTQAATTSSTLPKVQITWTDSDSGVVQTLDATVLNSGNTLTTVEGGEVPMFVAASTNVQYATTGLLTSGATPLKFSLHIKLEQA